MTVARAVAVVVLCLAAACTSAGEGVIALEGATLMDGAGGPPVRASTILIKDGHIQAVGRGDEIPVPRGAERVKVAIPDY